MSAGRTFLLFAGCVLGAAIPALLWVVVAVEAFHPGVVLAAVIGDIGGLVAVIVGTVVSGNQR